MSGAPAERLSAPYPRLESQPEPSREGPSLEELVIQLLGHEKGHPVSYKELRRDIARRIDNQPDGLIRSTLARLVERRDVLDFGNGEYFLAGNLERVALRICEVIGAYHATYPYEAGMPTGEIKKRYSKGKTLNTRRNIDPRLFDLAFSACKERGDIVVGVDGVRLSSYHPTVEQLETYRRLDQAVLAFIGERRYHQIEMEDLSDHLGVDLRMTKVIVSRLLKAQDIIRYGENRYMEAPVLDQVKTTLSTELNRASRLKVSEIKELLGIPRNAVIDLLESLDGCGFTRRDGEWRSLANTVSNGESN